MLTGALPRWHTAQDKQRDEKPRLLSVLEGEGVQTIRVETEQQQQQLQEDAPLDVFSLRQVDDPLSVRESLVLRVVSHVTRWLPATGEADQSGSLVEPDTLRQTRWRSRGVTRQKKRKKKASFGRSHDLGAFKRALVRLVLHPRASFPGRYKDALRCRVASVSAALHAQRDTAIRFE